MDKSGCKKQRIIYGGSFNPVHCGHLRLALEALRFFPAARLDFVPVAWAPHKNGADILPFELRAELVRHAIAGLSGLDCNTLEKSLPPPSYSVRTIRTISEACPDEELYFLLGSSDYELLPDWRDGLELPKMCNVIVAPRGELDFESFVAKSEELWPGQVRPADQWERAAPACGPGVLRWLRICDEYRIFFLPAPWLNISATYIRSLWLCDGNIDFLLPNPVLDVLNRERQMVETCWRSINA